MSDFHLPTQAEIDEIRSRLPDVPFEFGDTVTGDDIDPITLRRHGMPRPKLRGVPIPATSLIEEGRVDIIKSEPQDWVDILVDHRCDLCALELSSAERAFFIAEEIEDDLLVRGMMHRQCWISAAHWCPHLREGLLNGSMVAASCSVIDLLDGEKVETLVVGSDKTPVSGHVIAEYRLAAAIVQPEWPFIRRRSS